MALADIYQKATLVQIPSGYKSGTLYSVVPNTADGDFTVTGDPEGEATRVNKDGLIESVSANVPRLNYDPTNPQDPHLLLEPTRQNYTGYSAQFDNSYWTKATSDSTPNPTVTANVATSPDGGSNADRVQLTAPPNNDWAVVKRDGINTGATVGSKLQQSLYLKAYDSSQVGKNVDVYMYDFSNTIYKTVYQYTLTADWERVVVEHTISGSNTSTNIQFAFGKARDSVGGSLQSETATDFLVWGGQLEKGTYPTSYIPTQGETNGVTRSADTCIDAGNNTIISSLDGGMFVDLTTTNDSNLKQINLFDGGNNRITIQVQFSTLSIGIVSNVGGTIQTLYNWDVNINTNDRHKIAIRYEENNSKLYYNGLLQTPTTYTGSWFNDGVLDNFSFDKSGAFPFYGEIHQAMVFNEALTDSELQTLTT